MSENFLCNIILLVTFAQFIKINYIVIRICSGMASSGCKGHAMCYYTQYIDKMLLLEKYESLMLRPNGFVGG